MEVNVTRLLPVVLPLPHLCPARQLSCVYRRTAADSVRFGCDPLVLPMVPSRPINFPMTSLGPSDCVPALVPSTPRRDSPLYWPSHCLEVASPAILHTSLAVRERLDHSITDVGLSRFASGAVSGPS
jgi:hypothetical protein